MTTIKEELQNIEKLIRWSSIMKTIKEELQKSYDISCLEGEIYLWQIYIIDHPEHRETYQKAIGENLDKLKLLEG